MSAELLGEITRLSIVRHRDSPVIEVLGHGPGGRNEVVDISPLRIIKLDGMPCAALPWASKFCGDPGARARLAAEDDDLRNGRGVRGGDELDQVVGRMLVCSDEVRVLTEGGDLSGGGHGNGPPQLLSTGEGEHSNLSMMRTAG